MNFRILLIVSSFVSIISAQVPLNGLIGAWTFNGNANDASTSANHGNVVNATLTSDRCGNASKAYHFNGFSSYILMQNTGVTGSLARSVSFWLKSVETTPWNPTAAFDYGSASGSFDAWQVVLNYCGTGIGIDNSNQAMIRPAGCLFDGNWHHIVVIFDPNISTMLGDVVHYIDGVQITSQLCNVSGTTSPISTGNLNPITIGKDAHSMGRYFDGDLDDFYFYNRALSAAEVLQLMSDQSCFGSGPTQVCIPASSIYSCNPVPGATSYGWTLPGGWTGTSTSNIISTTVGISGGAVSYSAFGSCGMIQSGIINVTVSPKPTITAAATKTLLCSNANELTKVTATGGTSYTWQPGGATGTTLNVTPTASTVYTVTGVNTIGCSNTATLSISKTGICTGIGQYPVEILVSISPNPSSGFYKVVSDGVYRLEIFNTLGQLVQIANLNQGENSVSLSAQPSGFYYFCLKSSAGSKTVRVIKE